MHINTKHGDAGPPGEAFGTITAQLQLKVVSLNQPILLLPKMTFLDNSFILISLLIAV